MITRHAGPLTLAKQIGDNPPAYSIDQLRDAIARLIAAKRRSQHSERAVDRNRWRIKRIRDELRQRGVFLEPEQAQ